MGKGGEKRTGTKKNRERNLNLKAPCEQHLSLKQQVLKLPKADPKEAKPASTRTPTRTANKDKGERG